MNERIKALLYEAGGQYNGHNVLTGVERVDTENVDYEKFAELIIKECINTSLNEMVDEEEIDKQDDIEDRCYLRGNNGGIVDSVVSIRQHFGVEE